MKYVLIIFQLEEFLKSFCFVLLAEIQELDPHIIDIPYFIYLKSKVVKTELWRAQHHWQTWLTPYRTNEVSAWLWFMNQNNTKQHKQE